MEKETIRYRYRGDKTCEQIEKDRLAQAERARARARARAQNPEPAEAPEPEPAEAPEPAPARKPKRKPKRKLKVVKPEPAPKPDPEPARKPKPEPPPPPEPPNHCNILNVKSVQECKQCEKKNECMAGLNFGQVPHFFITDYMKLLKISEIKVYLAISSKINFAEQSDFFNKVKLSYSEISELAGVSRGAVCTYLKTLEKLKLIKRTKMGRMTYISLVWLSKKLELKIVDGAH